MIAIAPMVEGYGEVESIRILIDRIWTSLGSEGWPQLLTPIRQPKSKLVQAEHLGKPVELAALKLKETGAAVRLILLLLDADDDCPGELGPELLGIMKAARSDLEVACCVANPEYETWFAASADTMAESLDLGGEAAPDSPEDLRLGKRWIARRIATGRYRETVDQPRLTARIDVDTCRRRSSSFDKLCREIERVARGNA